MASGLNMSGRRSLCRCVQVKGTTVKLFFLLYICSPCLYIVLEVVGFDQHYGKVQLKCISMAYSTLKAKGSQTGANMTTQIGFQK